VKQVRSANIKIEEIIGVIVGGIFFYMWSFAFIILSSEFGTMGYTYNWVIVGLLPFFLITGHYLVAGNVISKSKKTEDEVSIKSLLIGFFVWLFVAIVLTVENINIDTYAFQAGGYITLSTIYFYLRNKIEESDRYKGFTATSAIMIVVLLWSLYNLIIG